MLSTLSPHIHIFIPDQSDLEQALKRTTHMAIGAHQDDIEFMAASPILECFQHEHKWFTGVIATNGSGSPRTGLYQTYTNNQMQETRIKEQKKAAVIGEYSAQIFLNYASSIIKNPADTQAIHDIRSICELTQPEYIYTHNLADKHDTHVAVALRVIYALRQLPADKQPKKLIGCEVWRDLDWLIDQDKIMFDLSQRENIQAALMGVFDSQISGGKRYDLATAGRRKAHATYTDSHALDKATGLAFGIDLTPLIRDTHSNPADFMQEYINRFAHDVKNRIEKL
jgi:LmbE family N-acetylglucosaminyl deacetylase